MDMCRNNDQRPAKSVMIKLKRRINNKKGGYVRQIQCHFNKAKTKPNQTKPNQTKPNQTKPNQTHRQTQQEFKVFIPVLGLPEETKLFTCCFCVVVCV